MSQPVTSVRAAWDGVDHDEHSTDRGTYEAWSRWRRRSLPEACGVADSHHDVLLDASAASESESMEAYSDVQR